MDNCGEILSLREKLAAMIEAKNLVQCEVARLVKERDEARRCAEEMRDLYAAEIDESIQVFPWPWGHRMNAADAWNSRADEPKRIDGKPAGMSAEQFDACYEEDGDADAD